MSGNNRDHKPDFSQSLVEASRLVFLDAGTLRFSRQGILLSMKVAGGETYSKVSILRAFPLSRPNRFLSVRDAENKEIGLIADPGLLDGESQEIIEAELERGYLIPVITRILSAKERFGTVEWEVETDRGPRRFTTKNLRENVQRPAPGRIILNDIDDNRYDIRDIEAQDRQSQALLYRHL